MDEQFTAEVFIEKWPVFHHVDDQSLCTSGPDIPLKEWTKVEVPFKGMTCGRTIHPTVTETGTMFMRKLTSEEE